MTFFRVDYYFPWQIFLASGCIWDTLVSHFIPVFIYQRNTRGGKARDSQEGTSNHIKKCLLNKKWNAKFLIFNEKSYCPEDVMMWNAVEQFKSIKSNKKRVDLFQTIVRTYILIESPLELNIARSTNGIPDILSTFELLLTMNDSTASTSVILPSIFDEIQLACEHNMLDSFFRFHIQYRQDLESELGIKFDG